MVSIHFDREAAGDADLVQGFQDVAYDLLSREDMGHVHVRFLPWPAGAAGRPRYRCQVYAGPTDVFAVQGRWVWWSPVLDTPRDLAEALQPALRSRGVRSRRPSFATVVD